jgi:hypothetical protein
MLDRSIPWELPCWILPETTYLSSDGFGGERLSAQARSPGSQQNEKPRQRRNNSVTRRSVKLSTKKFRMRSPVRLRVGATATAMLGNRHGHCGCDLVSPPDRCAARLVGSPWSGIYNASTIMSCAYLISIKRQNRVKYRQPLGGVQFSPARPGAMAGASLNLLLLFVLERCSSSISLPRTICG